MRTIRHISDYKTEPLTSPLRPGSLLSRLHASLPGLSILLLGLSAWTARAQLPQRNISRVEQMSAIPQPLRIIDFNRLARRFDSTVFDFNAKGPFWPLVWIDSSRRNFPQDVVGMYTAIGDIRQGPMHNKGMFHEALANMGAVLGASLAGIDKSGGIGLSRGRNGLNSKINFVGMLRNYFNRETGWDIMMNNTCPEVALLGGGYGRDWWYDVYPNVLFYAICEKYPNEPGLEEIARKIADKFYRADSILQGNYNYSFFNYGLMRPEHNQICAQPDVAAGHAYVLYAAYKKFGDERYLRGAVSAMNALQAQTTNPTYEVLMPFGAYLAARINAEQGRDYDVMKMLDWSFDGTAICREGWGVLVGIWNGIDISGIVGSTVDHGGYGFLMNTYDAAWPLVPMVRYDQSFARSIGKWMLHAANAAKFFYPAYMPTAHQTLSRKAAVTKGVIAYEGIIRQSSYPDHASQPGPVAQGDGPLWVPGKNPPESQFSVYGSAHAGIFGSIIRNTDIPGILRLDLLATDFYRDKAYPSYLYYNPYPVANKVRFLLDKTVAATLPPRIDLYDAVTGRFIANGIPSRKDTFITLASGAAAVIVCTPAGGKLTYEGNKALVNGVIIDYRRQNAVQ